MARGHGYRVGDKVFPRKQDVVQACRDILYRYLEGQTLNDADTEFVVSLLANHPSVDHKIGCGISRITVEPNPEFKGNRGFWITRTDGSRTDFSFMQCISPSSPLQDFKAACRRAVKEQVIAFKNSVLPTPGSVATCPVTGDTIGPGSCHIDHEPPMDFDTIIDHFILAEDLDVSAVELRGGEDGQIGDALADESLAARWRVYHALHAKLRAVSVRANLSVIPRSSGQRRKSGCPA